MPKPTRRERRQLAEKGKLAPRRAPVGTVPATAASVESRMKALSERATPQVDTVSIAQEYAYVKADLIRIFVLAVALVGTMVALRFALPQ